MIMDMLIGLGLKLLGGLIGLMPAYELPDEMLTLGATIGNTVSSLNGIFPVVTLGVCLLAVIGLMLFLAVWDLIVFVYDKIPFKAT